MSSAAWSGSSSVLVSWSICWRTRQHGKTASGSQLRIIHADDVHRYAGTIIGQAGKPAMHHSLASGPRLLPLHSVRLPTKPNHVHSRMVLRTQWWARWRWESSRRAAVPHPRVARLVRRARRLRRGWRSSRLSTGVLPARKDGHVPRFRVRPAERLVMRVTVTVPGHVTITALWFGISADGWGDDPERPNRHEPGPGSLHPAAVRGIAHVRLALAYPASKGQSPRWRCPSSGLVPNPPPSPSIGGRSLRADAASRFGEPDRMRRERRERPRRGGLTP
jgi:hypothetical protein